MKVTSESYLDLIYGEAVTAERFLEICNREQDSIESVRVILDPLGSPEFGRFFVRYKHPRYLILADRQSANGRLLRPVSKFNLR